MKFNNILVALISLIILNDGLAQTFRFSEGLYRVPYEDGVNVNMGSDVWTHNPVGKYDMWADGSNEKIVAAADGWIRGIQESFDTACFVNCCWQWNNYVIIEHPNGEWSGYTHMQIGSSTDEGISVNQWVTAGTPIGVEGTVGCSSGRHLHWEVSRPAPGSSGFATSGGFLQGELLIPVICGIGTGESWFVQGNDYVAGPCDDNCATTVIVEDNLSNGDEYVARADNAVLTALNNPVTFFNGSVSQMRSGHYVLLRPGFEARGGAQMEIMIKTCNEQE